MTGKTQASETTPEVRDLSGRFGRYEIERLLGRGGMGSVYLARQLDLQRRVVIKVISQAHHEGPLLERFRREAQAAARIDSDNVIKVYETGRVGQHPFIAMEFVDGRSAADLVADTGYLQPVLAATIVAGALRGLAAAHEAGIVHRDVKPANILVARDGRVKVADFGVAKLHREQATPPADTITNPGSAIGTPAYMAPEQARGLEVEGKADIYALGVTFYELLTARLPFRGASTVETLSMRLSQDPIPPSQLVAGIPETYETVCLTLMTREPGARPGAKAALAMLEGLAAPQMHALAALFVPADPRAPTLVDHEISPTRPAPPIAASDAPTKVVKPVPTTTRPGQPAASAARRGASTGPTPSPGGVARTPSASRAAAHAPTAPSDLDLDDDDDDGEGEGEGIPVATRLATAVVTGVGVLLLGLVLIAYTRGRGPAEPGEAALADERAKQEAAERAQQAAAERAKQEAAERAKREAADAERAKKEEVDRARTREEIEKLKTSFENDKQKREEYEKKLLADKERAERERNEALAAAARATAEARATATAVGTPAPTAAPAATPSPTPPPPPPVEQRDPGRDAVDRLVEAIKSRQSAKIATVRDEIKKGPPFPDRDTLVRGADEAQKSFKRLEDHVKAIPAKDRPDLLKATLDELTRTLLAKLPPGNTDRETRWAISLLTAVAKQTRVGGDFVVRREEGGEEIARFLMALGLERPEASGPPTRGGAKRPPGPPEGPGNSSGPGNGPGGKPNGDGPPGGGDKPPR